MSDIEKVQLFEDKKVRTVWGEEEEKWYFSILDVIEVLAESKDPTDYFKKMRKREAGLAEYVGTNCPQVEMLTPTGKHRKTLAGELKVILRIIESIPSKKAEPFKRWMAQVASERIDEMQDPELAIDRGYEYYRRLGYSEAWINERMKGKDARKALTDEWKRTGVSDGQQFATLTDIITQEWSGMTTRQYKNYKGLKKENLRDHMTRTESALNTLAEVAATELSRQIDPKGFNKQKSVAKRGGHVAATARRELEKQLGQSVVTKDNAKALYGPEAPKEIEEQ